MSEAVRVRKNSIYSILSISSRLIANVFVFWIMARYYGSQTFGQFTSAHTLSTIFILLADFGFDIFLTTELARNKQNAVRLFQLLYSLKVVFSFIALIVMWSLSMFGNFSTETKALIFILSIYTIFTALSNFIFAFYKGLERLEYETKVSLFINIGLILIAFPLIILKVNVLLLAVAFVATRVFGFVIGIILSRKLVPGILFKLDFNGFIEVKNKILVFGFFLLFNNLFFQLDTILLSLWKGDHEVGVYQAVFKLVMLPLVIPDIFISTLMPLLSRLKIENELQWKKVGYLMNKILLAIVVPFSIVLFVYSEQIIKLIYGINDYSDSVPILRIFALTLFIRFSSEACALMLTTSNRQKVRLYTVIIATLLNFIINYFLIPHFGTYGAAITSLITNFFVGIIYYMTNSNLILEFLLNVKVISFLVISLAIAYLFWLINSVSIFFSAPVIGIIFSLIAYMFFFTKEERVLILSSKLRFPFVKKNQK